MIRNYDKLIFELSKEGRTGYSLPKNVFKENYCPCQLPAGLKRESKPLLPEVTEFDVVRHYTISRTRTLVSILVSTPWAAVQ